MRIELLDLLARRGAPIDPIPVPENYFAEYAGRLPELVLDLWRELGFSGLGNGLLWFCDPYRWQPIVDAWLASVELPAEYAGDQIPILRTAYGKIYCFRPGLGQKIEIEPLLSGVHLFRPEVLAGQEWIGRGITDLLTFPDDQFLVDADHPTEGDDPQEDLFERIVERLGRTAHDTVYSFAPRIQEDGALRAEHAVIADAATELAAVLALQAPELTLD
ncbi:GAD-like domain-containing protein [Nocardia sp. NPDC057353]|uniref:GAD-like domain-containing protein n=1 Tax=Nocardia sp. NPDC057353 TaxID=3346104 RepID=UPI00363AE832